MQHCSWGFRSTAQTFLKDRSILCVECGGHVPLELALYTGHDPLPALEPSRREQGKVAPYPRNPDPIDTRGADRLRPKSSPRVDG